MPPQNVSLWHEDYFRLLFLRNNRDRRSSDKLRRSYPSARDVYIYKGNHPCEGVSPTACGRGGASQSLETLISGEGGDFHLHGHLTLVCRALPENLPERASPQAASLAWSRGWCLRRRPGPRGEGGERYSVCLGLHRVCRGDACS